MKIVIGFALLVLAQFAGAQDLMAASMTESGEMTLAQITELIRFGGVLMSVIVVIATWLLLRLLHRSVERLSEQFAHKRLVFQKLETFTQFLVYIIVGFLIFNLSFKINDKALALIGGTLAVSVGFALKDLVASIVAGIMIMIDQPFQVGDRLEFGGKYGEVLSIGLRSVRINTLDDDIVTIPNNKFLNDITQSGNFGALDMHVGMNFYISYDQDVELAREIISEAAASSRYVHLPRPIVVLVSQQVLDNYIAIKLRLKAYVLDTHYEQLFITDVNLRVISEFNKQGIQPAAVLHRNIDHKSQETQAD